jgi:hypothetical protein
VRAVYDVCATVRSSGLGVTTVFARVGGALSPWMCQWLYWRSRYLAVYSCVLASCVAGVIAARMPKDTRGMELDVKINKSITRARERDNSNDEHIDDRAAGRVQEEKRTIDSRHPIVVGDPYADDDSECSAEDVTALPSSHRQVQQELAAEAESIRASLNLDILKSTPISCADVAGLDANEEVDSDREAHTTTQVVRHKQREAAEII